MDRKSEEVLHLDVKFQVLVHGVDVVKDVMGDARDDPHQLGVVQFALNTTTTQSLSIFLLLPTSPGLKGTRASAPALMFFELS